MAIWQQFPFTNFHQENLDWMLNNMKNLDERVEAIERHGGASKDYVDEQDNLLDEKIVAERSARTQNDQMLQQQITAHTTSIGQLSNRVLNTEKNIGTKGDVPAFANLWQVVGNYNATQALGDKLLQVQQNEQTNSRSIAGTGGTYDLSKGTIQARLNTLESGNELTVVKESITYSAIVGVSNTVNIRGSTVNANSIQVTPLSITVNAYPRKNFSNETYFAATAGNPDAAISIQFVPNNITYNTATGLLYLINPTDTPLTFNSSKVIVYALNNATKDFVTNVSGNVVSNGAGDVTKSYVDSQDAALDEKITTAQTAADSAVTMATEASDKAESANTNASKATSDATSALNQIGSKSSSVAFANLWATIGAWAEAVPMTERINSAYNWSGNNRSAINGSADYPTDKDPINARLTELEGIVARLDTGIKIARGNTMVYQDKQQLIDFQSAGFTEMPTIVASYSSTEDSAHTTTRSIQIFSKSNIAAVLQLSGVATTEGFPVDWIAIGK